MLCQSMEHVIQEANASIHGNLLRGARLRGMAMRHVEKPRVCVRWQFTAIKVDGQLDLGLIGIAGESRPPRLDNFC